MKSFYKINEKNEIGQHLSDVHVNSEHCSDQ